MPIARSSLAGAATGIVLLAGAVGFGVGLPEVIEDPAGPTATADLPELPDRLDDRFIALSAVTPEDVKAATAEDITQTEAVAKGAAESEKLTRSRLTALYGDTAVRLYLDIPAIQTAQNTPEGQTAVTPPQLAITVVPGDPGLVIPSGPFQTSQQGTNYELTKVGDYRCSIYSSVPADPLTGQPTGAEPTGANYQVQCRGGRDGLSYDAYSTGLTPDETAGYLDKVLELTKN